MTGEKKSYWELREHFRDALDEHKGLFGHFDPDDSPERRERAMRDHRTMVLADAVARGKYPSDVMRDLHAHAIEWYRQAMQIAEQIYGDVENYVNENPTLNKWDVYNVAEDYAVDHFVFFPGQGVLEYDLTELDYYQLVEVFIRQAIYIYDRRSELPISDHLREFAIEWNADLLAEDPNSESYFDL